MNPHIQVTKTAVVSTLEQCSRSFSSGHLINVTFLGSPWALHFKYPSNTSHLSFSYISDHIWIQYIQKIGHSDYIDSLLYIFLCFIFSSL